MLTDLTAKITDPNQMVSKHLWITLIYIPITRMPSVKTVSNLYHKIYVMLHRPLFSVSISIT